QAGDLDDLGGPHRRRHRALRRELRGVRRRRHRLATLASRGRGRAAGLVRGRENPGRRGGGGRGCHAVRVPPWNPGGGDRLRTPRPGRGGAWGSVRRVLTPGLRGLAQAGGGELSRGSGGRWPAVDSPGATSGPAGLRPRGSAGRASPRRSATWLPRSTSPRWRASWVPSWPGTSARAFGTGSGAGSTTTSP